MGVYFILQGFKELDETFKDLEQQVKRPDLLAKNVFKPAILEALQPIAEQMKQDARYDANRRSNVDSKGKEKPHLRDTVTIQARFPTDQDKNSMFISDKDTYIGVVGVKKSAVSLAQEFGTANVSAKPFIRQAFDGNVETVTNIMKNKLAETLPAQLIKLKKYQGYK